MKTYDDITVTYDDGDTNYDGSTFVLEEFLSKPISSIKKINFKSGIKDTIIKSNSLKEASVSGIKQIRIKSKTLKDNIISNFK